MTAFVVGLAVAVGWLLLRLALRGRRSAHPRLTLSLDVQRTSEALFPRRDRFDRYGGRP